MTRPNNVTTDYTYDNLSRLLSVLHKLSGGTIDGATYTVDAVGNRTAKANQLPSAPAENYTYDSIYQLTQVVQNGSTTTESYTYDPVGNRLSSLAASPWNYNVSNHLTSISGSPGTTFTYDNNGNTTSKTDAAGTTTYTWDHENRLTSVILPGSGGTVTFNYDPFGRRVRKVGPSGTTVFAYDEDSIIEETNAGGTAVARYAMGLSIDEPLAMLRSSATHYYSTDGLGSVTSLTNGSGAVAASYTYDAFGNLAASTGSVLNPLRYTAREWDVETGFYYYRARHYDQTTGRFLSEDPIGSDDASNFYAYVSNDPTNLTDPLGLYATHPDVPKPLPPRLDKFMKCLDDCTGKPQYVRATSNEKHTDPGHAAGTSVDLRPVGTPSNKLFCCAGQCGAKFVLDERKIKTKLGSGAHYHIQLELSIIPKAPNSIPDTPECKPKGCDAKE